MSQQTERGRVLIEQRRFLDAEKILRESLGVDPNDPEAHYLLSVSLANQKRHKEALLALDAALALEPESSHYHAYRACIFIDLDRPKDAEAAAREAVRLDPDSGFAHRSLAAVLLSRKNWKEAEASALKALELDPDDSAAANVLAHVLRLQNRLGESSAQTDFMLSENPEDPDTRVSAGWVALQRGEHRAAEEHFLEALRLDASHEFAKEGLKEAFRARSPLYRSYLSYCFALQRFTADKQWLFFIGLIVGVKFLRTVLPPPAAIGVIALYLLFVLWVHVARPVGNFGLLLDRFARHSLDRREKLEAILSGCAVMLGLLLGVAGFAVQQFSLVALSLGLIGAAFPFAHAFTNGSLPGSILFAAAGCFVLATGVWVGLVEAGLMPDRPEIASAAAISMLTVVAVTWLSNVTFLRRPYRG